MDNEESQESEAIGATARVLGGGLAAVVTTAGVFGATTGGLARLLRNAPGLVAVGLIAAAAAVVIATVAAMYPTGGQVTATWRRRMLLLAISGVLLLLGFATVVWAQIKLIKIPYRPQVSVSFGSAGILRVSATADSLAVGDRLCVYVLGVNRFSEQMVPVRYYSGNVGGNADGVARQDAEARLLPGNPRVNEVQVVAVVRREPGPGEWVKCDGTVFSAGDTRTLARQDPPPACLVIRYPPSG